MKSRFGFPLAWAAATVLILVLEALPPAMMHWSAPDYAFQDTYYVVANWHYGVSFATACAVFAVVYSVLRPASPLQRRLAWAHLATFVIGCALIFWPMWVLTPVFGLPGRGHDPLGVFTWANWASTVGYAITLLGLLIFVWFLAIKLRALASNPRPSSG